MNDKTLQEDLMSLFTIKRPLKWIDGKAVRKTTYSIDDLTPLLQLINRIGEDVTAVDHPEGNATERGKGFYEGLDTVRQRLSLLTGKGKA